MSVIDRADVIVPAIVPEEAREEYVNNFMAATRNTGRLMMFAGDQKVEHLNDDFFGDTQLGHIAEDDRSPDHLFSVAENSEIGVFATQLGLVSRYGPDHRNINYMVKLNSKSHLVSAAQQDPISRTLWTVDDVVKLKQRSGLNIVGIGYTCYLGSEFETEMFAEAARVIYDAQTHGLISCIWMYPRGKAITDEKSPHLIAGAAGVAACLGADFVKVNFPHGTDDQTAAEAFQEAIWAADRTGVICAGGGSVSADELLQQLYDQIHTSGAQGNATGRNIHQRDHDEAVRLCNAISSITLGDHDVEFARRVYRGEETFKL